MPPDTDGAGGVLEARDVCVRFGGVQALLDVSMSVAAGCVTGLIGPNGAGKTTFFDVLTGMRRPDGGRVTLGDRDVTRLGTHRRARLGLARTFQRLELFWSLSVEDNVLVGAEARDQWWVPHRSRPAGAARSGARANGSSRVPLSGGRAAVPALLDRVGLGGLGAVQVGSLPTGQARLVELARALATSPRVLLLDEPSSGLDDAESRALGDLLVDLAHDGMAVLLVEHDMDLLMSVSGTITVLDTGSVISSGTPEHVRNDAAVRSAYLGDAPPGT